ncbi:MAG: hypothetical protein WA532_03205 [Candidatus Korobacteraceae bacterium]
MNATAKSLLAIVCLCIGLSAQPTPQPHTSASSATTKKAAGRAECVVSVGLCVTVPASWQRLGNIFDDLGFVVAEPHPGVDSGSLPQLTVAAIGPLPNEDNGEPPSLDSVVDLVLTPGDTFASVETLQRSHLLLNGAEAEMVRVQFHDKSGDAGPIEDVALIQGSDGLVYSIALRCAPQDFPRLEPLFQQTAQSWHLQPVASAPVVPALPTPAPAPSAPAASSQSKPGSAKP